MGTYEESKQYLRRYRFINVGNYLICAIVSVDKCNYSICFNMYVYIYSLAFILLYVYLRSLSHMYYFWLIRLSWRKKRHYFENGY